MKRSFTCWRFARRIVVVAVLAACALADVPAAHAQRLKFRILASSKELQ